MSDNMVLSKIFGRNRDDIIRDGKGLRNEEHRDLYLTLNMISGIKSRDMRWKGHVVCMG